MERGDFIFSDYRFLLALEKSGCLGARTGWHPMILIDRDEKGIAGALVLFAKSNSYGEYIFDWGWANAAERAGLQYYPKLVAAIPFTPATGAKFLTRRDVGATARQRLLQAAFKLQVDENFSSTHFLFISNDEATHLKTSGLMIRDSFQFHWRRRESWQTFDDFLLSFRSSRRKEIRRERESVKKLGLTIDVLTSHQLTEEHASLMAYFYRMTISKMGGIPYLTPEFFKLVVQTMPENILFVLAKDPRGEAVAGALNFFQGETLFGRYWGSTDAYKHLHFEVCYYKAIEWGLANGIQLFEAGAQGEHKFNRGFTPHLTLSAHRFRDQNLGDAVENFLEKERGELVAVFQDYAEHDPFKRT